MAEDLGQEDVVGLVSGFELVAADSSVSAAQVARLPGFVQRAEGGGNVLGQLRAGGGVDGIGAREGFQGPELIERADDLFWIGEDRDRIRLEVVPGAWRVLSWPSKMMAGKGSFLGGKLKLALKKISAGIGNCSFIGHKERPLLKRLVLGVSEASGGLLRLGAIMIPPGGF